MVAAAVVKTPAKPVAERKMTKRGDTPPVKEVTPAVEKPVVEVVKKEPDAPVVTTPTAPKFSE